jgi:hypothetical protein
MATSPYRGFSFTIALRSTRPRRERCIIEVPKMLCSSWSMSVDTLANIV